MSDITTDGWVKWAKRVDGPRDKVYTQPNSCDGFACHSIVGEESAFQDGIPDRFLSELKNPDGSYTSYAAASCQFINRKGSKGGQLIQMYPLSASTWTTGSRGANCSTVSMEAEGGGPAWTTEPLDEAQEDNFVRLIKDISEWNGKLYVPNSNVLQHKQWVQIYGGGATACASERYQGAWRKLLASNGDEEMTPEEKLLFGALANIVIRNGLDIVPTADIIEWCPAGTPVHTGPIEWDTPTVRLTGDNALFAAAERGYSFAVGLRNEQIRSWKWVEEGFPIDSLEGVYRFTGKLEEVENND